MIVELESSEGNGVLLFDVEEPGGRRVEVSKDGEHVVRAQASVSEAISQARRSAELLLDAIRGLDIDQAELTFGLKMTGEAGLFAITKVGGEAHCAVTLRWSHRQEEDRPSPPSPSRTGDHGNEADAGEDGRR